MATTTIRNAVEDHFIPLDGTAVCIMSVSYLPGIYLRCKILILVWRLARFFIGKKREITTCWYVVLLRTILASAVFIFCLGATKPKKGASRWRSSECRPWGVGVIRRSGRSKSSL